MKKLSFIILALIGFVISSCENQDWDFPDYGRTTVYFAYQSPVRTLCMGEDQYDTSLDNAHQCMIYATMGGVYSNNKDRVIKFHIDNNMVNNLKFDKENGNPILAMPSNYYTLSSNNEIVIKKGKLMGGVTVTFTDAYFNDPKALSNNYVIPIVMDNVAGADSILCGVPGDGIVSPRRPVADDWQTVPKDYTLYAVKYINKYDANYLRRGVDTYTGAINKSEVRHAEYVEKDEVVTSFTTKTLKQLVWDRATKDANGNNVPCELVLSFDDNDKCTISTTSAGMEVTGTGEFVSKGDKNSWGNKDRDALYLKYTLEHNGIKCETTDTLVVRDRGIKVETFSPVL